MKQDSQTNAIGSEHGPSGHPQRRGRALTTSLWIASALAAAITYLSSFTVREGEVAFVARFGDMRRLVEEPGLHFRWPAPIDALYRIDMRTHLLDPEFGEFLTSDQKQLEVDAFVAWRVADPMVYMTNLQSREGADERIADVLQSATIEVFNESALKDVIGTEERARDLATLATEIRGLVAERCATNGYGVAIVDVGIERVTFPGDNMRAIEDSMKEERRLEASKVMQEASEKTTDIDVAAKAEAARIRAAASEKVITITGQARAKRSRIESDAAKLNPELYQLLSTLEISAEALRGQLLILPSDDPLLQVLKLPAKLFSPKEGGD